MVAIEVIERIARASLCACLLIVTAFESPLAAGAIVEDVPVPGGAAALARSLGIDPVPDRGRFMSEVTRLLYDTAEIRNPSAAMFLQTVRQAAKNRMPIAAGRSSGSSNVVPVPLADVWEDAIFRRRVPREELVLTILADRQASLVCHGLAELDDETLAFFNSHPGLVTRLYERSAPIFAAFAGSVRVRDNRVVPPGEAEVVALWEAVAAERVTRPERFLVSLFEASDGRLAYLYDTVAHLDPSRQAFVLGTWMPDPATRLDRFKALALTGLNGLRDWHVRVMPFGRASFDLGMALMRLGVEANGAPSPPAARAVWSRILGGPDTSDESSVDAAWVAENIVSTDVRQRGERIDQLSFAQRVFRAQDSEPADLVFVLRSFPRFRALMLAFERVGITKTATYAEVIRHASRWTKVDGRAGYVAEAQFQGALALLTRMASVGTLDRVATEGLIDRLVASQPVGAAGGGAVARWLHDDLHPALPRAQDFESALIAGLSGPSSAAAQAPRVIWEGQPYRLDLAAAERNRLQRVREKQEAPRLDMVVQMSDAARLLSAEKVSAEDFEDVATQFSALASDLPQRSREEEADNVPSGVPPPAPHQDVLRKAADELTRAARNKDLKRGPRIAEPIVELADDLLARNLLSFAYAMSVGDPEGTILLAADVSHRHDFGFGLKDADMRARVTWAVPRQEVSPGSPWHVSGSLLALDAALSTLALRRIASDHVLEAPRLTTNTRDTFAASVSLMDPFALRDADRDAIVAAIERGRRRALEATETARLDGLATELAIGGARRRALTWTLKHEPERVLTMLSLTELLALGGARVEAFHPWGMAVTATNGCLCSRMMPPGAWPALSGRPQLGLAALVVPDLNLRIAMLLKDLGLPAPLAKVVLSAAVQDFIDEVRPTDDGDWLTLSRQARAVTRERVEDYVAAATATGPLMPEATRTPERERQQLVAGGSRFEARGSQ